MKTLRVLALSALAFGMVTVSASAQTLKQEVIGDLEGIHSKVVGLAQTVPNSTYTWRPAEGVRSIGEVYMHIASANFRFPGMLGMSPPEGTPEGWISGNAEGVTTEQAVAALNASFSFMTHAVNSIADINGTVEVFGRRTNARGFLLIMSTHLHEHLGQSIAYARTNGIVPPWSGM